MKKLKKLMKEPGALARALVALLVIGVSLFPLGVVMAQWNLPTGPNGVQLEPSEAPCIPYHIDGSSGTAEQLVSGTASLTGTAAAAPGYLAWVQLSSGTYTTYLSVRDTDKINATNTTTQKYEILPPLLFPGIPGGNSDTGKIGYFQFRPPLRFNWGLTAVVSLAGQSATLCTRKLATQVP